MKQLKDVKQAAKRGDPLSKRMFSVMSNVDLQEWAIRFYISALKIKK